MTELNAFIEAWRLDARDLHRLLSELAPGEWELPTDCPAWTVRDVVAHLAALEHEMATGERPGAIEGDAREVVSSYTQAGVEVRRDRTPAELTSELDAASRQRAEQLRDTDLSDPTGAPDRTPGGIAWDWQTLLRNRVVDLWVHEQDIRRATDRPGGMDTPGADITTAVFTAALPYVIGKRVAPDPGTTIGVHVGERATAYSVDADGRCHETDTTAAPTTGVRMSREAFTVLAAGRRDPQTQQVDIDGDRELAERLLRSLALTP